jgi:hypothetical protein
MVEKEEPWGVTSPLLPSSFYQRRRRSGPVITSTLAIAPSLARAQAPPLALVPTQPDQPRDNRGGVRVYARHSTIPPSRRWAVTTYHDGLAGRADRRRQCPIRIIGKALFATHPIGVPIADFSYACGIDCC